MKNVILVIITTFTLSQAFASKSVFVDYKCVAPDVSSVNKLEMTGEIELFTTDNSFNENEAELRLTKAGIGQPTSTHNIAISGKVRHFTAGQLAVNEVFQVQSIKKGRKIQVVNILIGHPGPQSSYIRTSDGSEFRGRCGFLVSK